MNVEVCSVTITLKVSLWPLIFADKSFARTLTSRLAKKISSAEDTPPKKLLTEDDDVKSESQVSDLQIRL